MLTFLFLVSWTWAPLPAAQALPRPKPLTTAQCRALLEADNFRPVTRFYARLRRLLDSPEIDPSVRQLVRERDHFRAIAALERMGKQRDADELREYVEASLVESDVLAISAIGRGDSRPRKVSLRGGIEGVFKPYPKAWKSKDKAWVANGFAEILAYRFDRALGLGMVPVTVERTIGGVPGTLQLWVPAREATAISAERISLERVLRVEESRRVFRAFDYLINNQDRHNGNFLLLLNDYLEWGTDYALIDHGVAFVPTSARGYNGPYPREVFTGAPLPDGFHRALRERLPEQRIDELLRDRVPAEVVELVQERRRELLAYQEERMAEGGLPVPPEARALDDLTRRVRDMNRIVALDRKHAAGEPFTTDDLRFLYEVDSPIRWYGREVADRRIRRLLAGRNARADLARVFGVEERQLSLTREEALAGGILVHFGDLDLQDLRSARDLRLPARVMGTLNLNGLRSTKGLRLPAEIDRHLELDGLKSARGLVLPKRIGGALCLSGLKRIDGLKLPEWIGGNLILRGMDRVPENLDLPPGFQGVVRVKVE